ncbi:uncharacterized protein TRIADDRAFT_51593 [Trichoplax adhaerens]|uniref:Uncharacterized protein n=1 Tax=Trichoplax adhaerens TaxID=10228 RepID=B3RK19_TRIAD|nr:predicted protein [Trichoplax adhaerens]EDV29359.1 predicted protein [Trichoplax adhaerens]|eukprot:XP_002108561.1 predicted protein [Trichoplax adhaerens]
MEVTSISSNNITTSHVYDDQWMTALKASIINKVDKLPEEALKGFIHGLIQAARGSYMVSWRRYIRFKLCTNKKPREKIALELEKTFLKYQDEFQQFLDAQCKKGKRLWMIFSVVPSSNDSLSLPTRRISVGHSSCKSKSGGNNKDLVSSPSKYSLASSLQEEGLTESFQMDKNEDIEMFIRRFNMISQLQGWPKEERFLRLENSLIGKAKSLYCKIRQESYDNFIQELKRECKPDFDECRSRFFVSKNNQEGFEEFIKQGSDTLEHWKRVTGMSTKDLFLLEKLRSSLMDAQFQNILACISNRSCQTR